MATSMRLTIPERQQPQPHHHRQLLTNKLQHLHSVAIAAQLVLLESNYLTHIVSSFRDTYHVDILGSDPSRLNNEPQECADPHNCLH